MIRVNTKSRDPRAAATSAGLMLVAGLLAGVPAVGADVNYLRDIKPLLRTRCYACHGARKQESNLRLDTAAAIRQGGESGPAVDPKDVAGSLLLERVTSTDEFDRMPPEGERLTDDQVALLRNWIAAGGTGPAEEQGEPDPRRHWAFQPLAPPQPELDRSTGAGSAIDTFIDARLAAAGLSRNPPADAVTLIRRMFLDLHGLPPSAAEVDFWADRLTTPEHDAAGGKASAVKTADAGDRGDPLHPPSTRLNPHAIHSLIDTLLGSTRYGERWAQHWLDVVRYADTHGFEVNTPRPHAWPYRDYVIRAFNDDKPYRDFIVDQIAGDTTGEDAATGFLVAAAALLPGQIGKDDASKRLARQDALDEIIVGTSATLLGVTLGCARCHDHKFDPFSQEDYYAMQAFFAGVDYGDRELRDAARERRLREAARLAPRIEMLTARLRAFEPLAYPGRTIQIDDEDAARVTSLATKNGHGTNPAGQGRGYREDAGDEHRTANLSHGRYTWWPNKPGEDVFTWDPQVAGTFRVWISWGTHGSGVHTRDARYVLDQDGTLATQEDQQEIARADQYYFAGVRQGESEMKPLWSGLQDVGVHQFSAESRLILRGGQTGTGVTADIVILQEVEPPAVDGDAANPSLIQPEQPRLRAPVSPRHNVERIVPTKARFLRFTTLATIDDNRHQPCLDELEVFAAGEPLRNVALATYGTQVSSSGNYAETGIHQLKHLNDGKFGNSWSWISNQHGGGWAQLEFPQVETIERIEWSRDREGNFNDRLAVRYRIDVSLDGTHWTTVARSDDRVAVGVPYDRLKNLRQRAGMERASEVPELIAELERLQARQQELERPRLVFGGKFREPGPTHVLMRGDPEQPLAAVVPRVPRWLGQVQVDDGVPEQQRRLALARWIASPSNPLTARVMVNRIWQSHFGRGLVDTPSDFGLNGVAPTHPELLDYLAQRFVEDGWSIKRLHRWILGSATYQQSAAMNPGALKLDAGNRLLWRFPSRRLEAEAIRDSMLAVSGRLNLAAGGPGFDFFKTRGGLSGFPPVESFTADGLRRMVFAHRVRMEPVPVFGAFDCPDAGQPTPRRSQSTTAIQALNLFNSPFVIEQAKHLARRVERDAGMDLDAQVDLLWRLTVGRRPAKHEAEACRDVARQHGLSTVCRVLFNSNEFLFLP